MSNQETDNQTVISENQTVENPTLQPGSVHVTPTSKGGHSTSVEEPTGKENAEKVEYALQQTTGRDLDIGLNNHVNNVTGADPDPRERHLTATTLDGPHEPETQTNNLAEVNPEKDEKNSVGKNTNGTNGKEADSNEISGANSNGKNTASKEPNVAQSNGNGMFTETVADDKADGKGDGKRSAAAAEVTHTEEPDLEKKVKKD